MLPVLFVIGSFCYPGKLYGQSPEYMLKAGFMERFTRFINWPQDSLFQDSTKPFKILILGKNPFGNELEVILTKTRIKERKPEIYYLEEPDTSTYYHMIFISRNMEKELPGLLAYTKGKPIITVSDTKGFGKQGVLINFYVEENKVRFEINRETYEESGLIITHHLLGFARIL